MNARVYLRALEPDDYKITINWRKDDDIMNMVGGPKYFISTEREKKWVLDMIFSNDKVVLGICLTENDKLIGFVSLHDIDYVNRSCHLSGMIGDKSLWNKGYFTEARLLLLKYAFDERGIERVTACPLEENESSIKTAIKCGYKVEGLARKAVFKDGKFHNVVWLSILRDEFYEAYNSYFAKYNQ